MYQLPSGKAYAAAVLVAAFAVFAFSFTVAAQGVFQCTGGPNEEQVGVDQQGPVTVPLCVTRPGAGQGGTADSQARANVFVPQHIPPPRGWRKTYGAWRAFETSQDPETGRYRFDYVISLGHATPQEAKAAVREQCEERRPLFDSPGTCEGYLIEYPYVFVARYPDGDYFGGQAGSYFIAYSTVPTIDGLTQRASGQWDICSSEIRPEGQCANVVAFLENGTIP